ncbi:hypothetical protein ACJX0J_026716, partial [Zea mays]
VDKNVAYAFVVNWSTLKHRAEAQSWCEPNRKQNLLNNLGSCFHAKNLMLEKGGNKEMNPSERSILNFLEIIKSKFVFKNTEENVRRASNLEYNLWFKVP